MIKYTPERILRNNLRTYIPFMFEDYVLTPKESNEAVTEYLTTIILSLQTQTYSSLVFETLPSKENVKKMFTHFYYTNAIPTEVLSTDEYERMETNAISGLFEYESTNVVTEYDEPDMFIPEPATKEDQFKYFVKVIKNNHVHVMNCIKILEEHSVNKHDESSEILNDACDARLIGAMCENLSLRFMLESATKESLKKSDIDIDVNVDQIMADKAKEYSVKIVESANDANRGKQVVFRPYTIKDITTFIREYLALNISSLTIKNDPRHGIPHFYPAFEQRLTTIKRIYGMFEDISKLVYNNDFSYICKNERFVPMLISRDEYVKTLIAKYRELGKQMSYFRTKNKHRLTSSYVNCCHVPMNFYSIVHVNCEHPNCDLHLFSIMTLRELLPRMKITKEQFDALDPVEHEIVTQYRMHKLTDNAETPFEDERSSEDSNVNLESRRDEDEFYILMHYDVNARKYVFDV